MKNHLFMVHFISNSWRSNSLREYLWLIGQPCSYKHQCGELVSRRIYIGCFFWFLNLANGDFLTISAMQVSNPHLHLHRAGGVKGFAFFYFL